MGLKERALLSLVVVGTLTTPALAQGRSAGRPKRRSGDTEVIEFVLPGRFKEAVARAKKLNRPLVIKGVAFGIDRQGATCATKGHW